MDAPIREGNPELDAQSKHPGASGGSASGAPPGASADSHWVVDISTERLRTLAAEPTAELSDALEQGRLIRFGQCPIELPPEAALLRDELGAHLAAKNVSWHPESQSLAGLEGDAALRDRASSLLRGHSERVRAFLAQVMPSFWKEVRIGTTSFRPIQEKGRPLSTHARNDLVHVDAGAYGATHGDRILRFFVNLNPSEDRVWITRGPFRDLYAKYAAAAGIAAAPQVAPGPLDRVLSSALEVLATVAPQVKMIDTSPYDRLMRRFHNYMKDDAAFRDGTDGLEEIRFPPFSAWMVLTDTLSHACTEGQHALVDTFVVPLANCRLTEHAPFHILAAGRP